MLDAPVDVVDDSMLLYQQPGIHQRSEKFNVLKLVSKSTVQLLQGGWIIPKWHWPDLDTARTATCVPLLHGIGNEFRLDVHSQMDWIWLPLLDLANHLIDSNAQRHKRPDRPSCIHLARSGVCVSDLSSTN